MTRSSVLLAALLLLALAACSGGGDASTTTATEPVATTTTTATEPVATTTSTTPGAVATTTATPPPQLDGPFDVVVAFYEALNTEDVEGMAALWPSGDRELFRLRTESLDQKVSATCFPGDAGEGSVRCEDSVGNDDFYLPAGRGVVVTVSYQVEGGVIVESDVVAWPEEWERYEEAFGAWLETAHPDLGGAFQGQGDYPFDTANDALAVIAVLDEFLAQSDEYPVG